MDQTSDEDGIFHSLLGSKADEYAEEKEKGKYDVIMISEAYNSTRPRQSNKESQHKQQRHTR